MSVQHSLSVLASSSIESICHALISKMDYAYYNNDLSGLTLVKPGIVLFVDHASVLEKEIIHEAYHFNPNISIRASIDKFELHESGISCLVEIINYLIENTNYAFVFYENGEKTLLLRTELGIQVDNTDPNWIDHFKSLENNLQTNIVYKNFPIL